MQIVTFLLIFKSIATFWPFSSATYWGHLFSRPLSTSGTAVVAKFHPPSVAPWTDVILTEWPHQLYFSRTFQQISFSGYILAFFVGYQLGGWFFKSPKFRRFSIKSGSMKTEQFNRPVLHKRYFCNSQPGHNEDGVAEMPMKRCKPAAGRFPTPRVPRANMGDLYHIDADGL